MMLLITLLWGTNWPLFPLAVREVSVWTFRSVALIGSGGLLLLLARLRGHDLRLARRDWKPVVLSTLSYLVVWNIASTYAAILIPSGQAAVLGFTMPLWSGLITWAVLGEKLDRRMVLALVLGGGGVLLLMVPSLAAYAAAPAGFALGLGSGLAWAIGTLILKRARVQAPVLVLTAWQLLLTAIPVSIGALILGDHQWFLPSWQSMAVIAWITLVPMCVGNLAWFSIVGMLPANVAGLSSVMVPVVAMVLGAIVHGEPLGPVQLASMGLCVTGLLLALVRKKK